MTAPHRTLTLDRVAAGAPEDDALVGVVQRAVGELFFLYGEIGRDDAGRLVFLAREGGRAAGREASLVVLRLTPAGGAAADEYVLDVLRTLDASLPADEAACPRCRKRLRAWGRFCTHCGADLSGLGSTGSGSTRRELLEAVRAAAAGTYDVLGPVPRAEGGGVVYFARELASGRLTALRLEHDGTAPAGEPRYALGVTRLMSVVTRSGERPAARADRAVSSPAPAAAGGPAAAHGDPLLVALREAAASEFDVLGEMGRRGREVVYLGRERATARLVALRLLEEPDGDHSLSVLRSLDATLPAAPHACPRCGFDITTWSAHCTRCGGDLTGERDAGGAGRAAPVETFAAVVAATAGEYQLLGAMERSSGGMVYFARRRVDSAIVGLRRVHTASPGGDGYATQVTNVLRAVDSRSPAHPAGDASAGLTVRAGRAAPLPDVA